MNNRNIPFFQIMATISDCGICLGKFQDPKLLPCSHTFCKQCLEGLPVGCNGSITCAECRAEIPLPSNGVDGFPSNRYMEEILRRDRNDDRRKCEMHDQPFTIYCNEKHCQTLACATCCILGLKHGGHKVVDVQEKGKEIRDEFDKNVEKYDSARETLYEKIEKVDDVRQKILNNSAKVQEELDTFKARLMEKIENSIQDLKAYAEEKAMAELAKIDDASSTLRDKVKTLNKTIAAMNMMKQVLDDGNVYNLIDKMDTLCLDDDPYCGQLWV